MFSSFIVRFTDLASLPESIYGHLIKTLVLFIILSNPYNISVFSRAWSFEDDSQWSLVGNFDILFCHLNYSRISNIVYGLLLFAIIFSLYLQLLQPSLYYPLADLTRYRGMALLLLQALQYIHYYFRKKLRSSFFSELLII